MLRESVTASLISYLSLMHVKEFGQLLIEIPSLLEKISKGLYYERMKLSYLCTAEYHLVDSFYQFLYQIYTKKSNVTAFSVIKV